MRAFTLLKLENCFQASFSQSDGSGKDLKILSLVSSLSSHSCYLYPGELSEIGTSYKEPTVC